MEFSGVIGICFYCTTTENHNMSCMYVCMLCMLYSVALPPYLKVFETSICWRFCYKEAFPSFSFTFFSLKSQKANPKNIYYDNLFKIWDFYFVDGFDLLDLQCRVVLEAVGGSRFFRTVGSYVQYFTAWKSRRLTSVS